MRQCVQLTYIYKENEQKGGCTTLQVTSYPVHSCTQRENPSGCFNQVGFRPS